MSQLLKLAKNFNSFQTNNSFKSCVPFLIDGIQVGLLRENVLNAVKCHPDVFEISPSNIVSLLPQYNSYQARSEVIKHVLLKWRADGRFIALTGWRNECFDVKVNTGDPPLMEMERSATCLFGIRQYGVHINGHTKHGEKGPCIWLQRRSFTKSTWPGMWDSMVGGGISSGASVLESATAEAHEEASIPPDLLVGLKPSGSVSFFYENKRGLFPSTEYVYDLELPESYVPTNSDGEVDSFELVPLTELTGLILSSSYKETSVPIALDFLIRHGYINATNEPYLAEITEFLHSPLHVLMYNQSLN